MRERERQTDRQTDREAASHTSRQTQVNKGGLLDTDIEDNAKNGVDVWSEGKQRKGQHAEFARGKTTDPYA